jgi:hypothetical protein
MPFFVWSLTDETTERSMQVLFKQLSRAQRERVRTIARNAYLTHPGNPKWANEFAADNIKAEFVASSILTAIAVKLLVAVAINLASKMIARWIEQKLTTPPLQYMSNEPGYER